MLIASGNQLVAPLLSRARGILARLAEQSGDHRLLNRLDDRFGEVSRGLEQLALDSAKASLELLRARATAVSDVLAAAGADGSVQALEAHDLSASLARASRYVLSAQDAYESGRLTLFAPRADNSEWVEAMTREDGVDRGSLASRIS